jgi:hypothetical protein
MSVWYYRANDATQGPVPIDELRRLFHNQAINGETPVWTESFGQTWRALKDAGVVSAPAPQPAYQPPPPPPQQPYQPAQGYQGGPVQGQPYAAGPYPGPGHSGQPAPGYAGGPQPGPGGPYPGPGPRPTPAANKGSGTLVRIVSGIVGLIVLGFGALKLFGALGGGSLPTCDNSLSRRQVTGIVENFEQLRSANVKVNELRNLNQVGEATRELRTCNGDAVLSNGRTIRLDFTHTLRDGQILTNVRSVL